MFVVFEHGVLYVLSFAVMITLSASAIAFVILLVTMACRSIWQLFR